jgi:Cu/Zn superoxide dismutase
MGSAINAWSSKSWVSDESARIKSRYMAGMIHEHGAVFRDKSEGQAESPAGGSGPRPACNLLKTIQLTGLRSAGHLGE